MSSEDSKWEEVAVAEAQPTGKLYHIVLTDTQYEFLKSVQDKSGKEYLKEGYSEFDKMMSKSDLQTALNKHTKLKRRYWSANANVFNLATMLLNAAESNTDPSILASNFVTHTNNESCVTLVIPSRVYRKLLASFEVLNFEHFLIDIVRTKQQLLETNMAWCKSINLDQYRLVSENETELKLAELENYEAKIKTLEANVTEEKILAFMEEMEEVYSELCKKTKNREAVDFMQRIFCEMENAFSVDIWRHYKTGEKTIRVRR